MLAKRKMSLTELSQKIITMSNLSILKKGKAKAIRFSTLISICKELDCQPGDILEYLILKIDYGSNNNYIDQCSRLPVCIYKISFGLNYMPLIWWLVFHQRYPILKKQIKDPYSANRFLIFEISYIIFN